MGIRNFQNLLRLGQTLSVTCAWGAKYKYWHLHSIYLFLYFYAPGTQKPLLWNRFPCNKSLALLDYLAFIEKSHNLYNTYLFNPRIGFARKCVSFLSFVYILWLITSLKMYTFKIGTSGSLCVNHKQVGTSDYNKNI